MNETHRSTSASGLDPYFRRIFEEIAARREGERKSPRNNSSDDSTCPQSKKVGTGSNRKWGQSKCNDANELVVAGPDLAPRFYPVLSSP
jgi:hypothetical protein